MWMFLASFVQLIKTRKNVILQMNTHFTVKQLAIVQSDNWTKVSGHFGTPNMHKKRVIQIQCKRSALQSVAQH